MNRLLLTTGAVLLAAMALADGPININNFIDGVTRPINFPTAGSSAGYYDGTGVLGATWRAEFVASDGTPIGAPVGFRSPGRLDFRSPNTADRIISGTPGVAQNITIRVWDTAVFPTWNEAAAALASGGMPLDATGRPTAAGSSTFSYTIPAGTPPPIGADRILNFQSFNLTTAVMPEPGVTALAAIGAAVLVWRGFLRKR